MRQISRVELGLLVFCLSVCVASQGEAQSGTRPAQRPAQSQQTQQQPASKASATGKGTSKVSSADDEPDEKREAKTERRPVFHAPTVSPELEIILHRWEVETAKVKTLHGKQTKTEYNIVFKVEKVTRGEFFFETPDKGRIDMIAVPVKKGEVSKKRYDKETKEPYEVETGISERWISTGEAIIQINDDNKTYQKMEIPESARGSNIVHQPLPFLFGMKAEEAKSRYQLTLFNDTEESVIIIVVPLMEKDRQNYKKAAITLNKKTYLPTEVRILSDGGIDIVYAFESVKINERKFLPDAFRNNPYQPNLKGYKLVIENDDAAEIQPVRGTAPRKEVKNSPAESAPSNAQKRPAPSTGNGSKTGSMNSTKK